VLFDISEDERRKAKSPHELFSLNLAVFHLLMAPAAIVLDVGMLGFLIPLAFSLSIIAFIWYRAGKELGGNGPWFPAVHWRLAADRTRILLVGYAISGSILGLAFLTTTGSSKGDIMMVALTRVGVVPVLLTVMVCFALESGSIYQAGRGEVPGSLVKKIPPPEGIEAVSTEQGGNSA
jgi:hypothetical protein